MMGLLVVMLVVAGGFRGMGYVRLGGRLLRVKSKTVFCRNGGGSLGVFRLDCQCLAV